MASIDKRPDGKYRARWREYPGGPQFTKHFDKKRAAEEHLVSVQHRLLNNTYTRAEAGKITLKEYSEEWSSRRSWAPSTTERIERELRLHILPKLGSWPIGNIRRSHIEEWVKALPLAPSSARMVFETLSNVLTSAVEDERIPRNPATGARTPTATTAPFVPLEPSHVRLLAGDMTEHLRAAVVVDAGTGLRQGELFGLTVDRVDFLRRELRVDQQLFTPGKGSPFLKAPKSKNSFRTVALSPLVVKALAVHLETFGEGEHRLLFHTEGRPVGRAMAAKHYRNAAASAITRAEKEAAKAKAAGRKPAKVNPATALAGTGWHDLRHHHASVLLSEGVSPALVAERLGHDLKTLLSTYAHVIRKDEDRVRQIVDEALGGGVEDWLAQTG